MFAWVVVVLGAALFSSPFGCGFVGGGVGEVGSVGDLGSLFFGELVELSSVAAIEVVFLGLADGGVGCDHDLVGLCHVLCLRG